MLCSFLKTKHLKAVLTGIFMLFIKQQSGGINMQGKVKFFDKKKGFGFITGEDGKDYFVHYTSLPTGLRLYENNSVTFDAVQGERGMKAENIVLIQDDSKPEEKKSDKKKQKKNEDEEVSESDEGSDDSESFNDEEFSDDENLDTD